jgi:hypothetical protein
MMIEAMNAPGRELGRERPSAPRSRIRTRESRASIV